MWCLQLIVVWLAGVKLVHVCGLTRAASDGALHCHPQAERPPDGDDGRVAGLHIMPCRAVRLLLHVWLMEAEAEIALGNGIAYIVAETQPPEHGQLLTVPLATQRHVGRGEAGDTCHDKSSS